MTTITLQPVRQFLKRTKTRCPVCHAVVHGEVWKEGDASRRINAHAKHRIQL